MSVIKEKNDQVKKEVNVFLYVSNNFYNKSHKVYPIPTKINK